LDLVTERKRGATKSGLIVEKRKLDLERETDLARAKAELRQWLKLDSEGKARRVLEEAWMPLVHSKGLSEGEIAGLLSELAAHIAEDRAEYQRMPLYPRKIWELVELELARRRRGGEGR
jgi:hypothetical protein